MPDAPSGLKIILALGGLSVLVVGTVVGWVAWQVHQESARWPALAETPAPQAPTETIPGDGRAWTLLSAAAERYQPDGSDFGEALAVSGRPMLDQLDVWRAQTGALESLRMAVDETTGLRIPAPASVDEPGPNLLPIKDLSEAWLLKAWADAEAGQTSLAVDEMLRVSRLGARLYEGETGLLGVVVGLHIHSQAVQELVELLAEAEDMDPALLAQAGAGLVPLAPGGVARGLVQDAQMMEALIQNLSDPEQVAEVLGGSAVAGLTYDPDMTLVWHRLHMQAQVDVAARPAWERQPVADLGLWDDVPWVIRTFHNPAGRVMLNIAAPSLDGMVQREDETIAASRLAALWIAAERYALAHEGTFPAGQDTLVPDMLSAPLIDPYDGQPLRLEAGAVWSAGEPQASDRVTLRRTL